MCAEKSSSGSDSEWLRKLRPWEGHDDHIHVRLHCQNKACQEQEPPPEGDGCGTELDEWMKKTAANPPYSSHPQPDEPPKFFPLQDLPPRATEVLYSKP
jgi:penicillin-insensitive murein endopeptidase